MEKLNKLISLCKGEVSICINENTVGHQTVEKYLEDCEKNWGMKPDISEEIKKIMIKNNQQVQIVFYPNTPIGSYEVWHYDMELALDECLRIMENVNK